MTEINDGGPKYNSGYNLRCQISISVLPGSALEGDQ